MTDSIRLIIAGSRDFNDIKQLESEDDYIRLRCWCKENEKCHGDVVISCLNWMNDNNLGE